MSKRLESLIERARRIIEEQEDVINDYSPAYEIQIFDFDLTLQHKYKPLPCVEILRDTMAAGIPCYIVTARKPNKGQEKHICDVLNWWDIKFNIDDVYALGPETEKGPTVLKLAQRHQAEKLTFWDDKLYNCESIYDFCFESIDELSIFHLSAAMPGDIRKEIRKTLENERLEIKHNLEERKIFRRWRRHCKL